MRLKEDEANVSPVKVFSGGYWGLGPVIFLGQVFITPPFARLTFLSNNSFEISTLWFLRFTLKTLKFSHSGTFEITVVPQGGFASGLRFDIEETGHRCIFITSTPTPILDELRLRGYPIK